MAKIIVSNTGSIISLEKLTDGFEFIRKLYDKIILPEAVLKELAGNIFSIPTDYLQAHDIEDLIEVKQVLKISGIPEIDRLDEGEKEAISLAQQLGLPLLIEETLGRQVASSSGIHISGIAGQIIKAYKENIIARQEAVQKLQELFSAGRINQKILNSLLAAL